MFSMHYSSVSFQNCKSLLGKLFENTPGMFLNAKRIFSKPVSFRYVEMKSLKLYKIYKTNQSFHIEKILF